MYEKKTHAHAAAAAGSSNNARRLEYYFFVLRYYCWQQWVPVNRACVLLVRRS